MTSAKNFATALTWDGAAEIARRFLDNPASQGSWMHTEEDLPKRVYLASSNFLATPSYGPLRDMFDGLASDNEALALDGFSRYMTGNVAWSNK